MINNLLPVNTWFPNDYLFFQKWRRVIVVGITIVRITGSPLPSEWLLILKDIPCSHIAKRYIELYFCCCCSVAHSYPTFHCPMDCSTPGFPVLLYLLEFAQTHVHWVNDAIQWSHPLLPSPPPALDFSQHQGLFQCVDSSHQVAKVLELQPQH